MTPEQQLLQERLIVGAQIRIGKKYAAYVHGGDGELTEGKIITLIEGYFDYENGLYVETQTAPSIKSPRCSDFDSIYHLFGNDLENFMDCEIVVDICYKTNEPCKYNCNGLCKESC